MTEVINTIAVFGADITGFSVETMKYAVALGGGTALLAAVTHWMAS